jgi:ABC-type nitrate/sulfonate/bicarbonate transport system substrate-binding protein
MRRWWWTVVAAAAFALAAVIGSSSASEREVRTVTVVGNRTQFHETFFDHMAELCPKRYGLELNFVHAPRYFDGLVILSRGDVDFAASGYATIPSIIEQGLPVVTIAGTNLGAANLVVRKGVTIKTWNGLLGKTVGAPSNSLITHELIIGLGQRKLDARKVKIISLVPSIAALIALQRGDVDAAMLWEPWATKAVEQGIGYVPFDVMSANKIGPINGVLQTTRDKLKNDRPMVEKFVRCMIESMRYLRGHPAEHIKRMQSPPRAATAAEAKVALKSFGYDPRIYVQSLAFYAHVMYRYGLTKTDTRDAVLRGRSLDFSVLEKITGRKARDLGKGSFATTRSPKYPKWLKG